MYWGIFGVVSLFIAWRFAAAAVKSEIDKASLAVGGNGGRVPAVSGTRTDEEGNASVSCA